MLSNDFRLLGASQADATGPLYETSCGRYDTVWHRLQAAFPRDAEECFAILDDPGVRMAITVQQMVFSARRGLLAVRTAGCPR